MYFTKLRVLLDDLVASSNPYPDDLLYTLIMFHVHEKFHPNITALMSHNTIIDFHSLYSDLVSVENLFKGSVYESSITPESASTVPSANVTFRASSGISSRGSKKRALLQMWGC
ncbi:hypothetical protein M5689_024873 [Euphorbia peplus]|nr:hypothetical protein M5689_024873 [Euphorbia peplus]